MAPVPAKVVFVAHAPGACHTTETSPYTAWVVAVAVRIGCWRSARPKRLFSFQMSAPTVLTCSTSRHHGRDNTAAAAAPGIRP